MILRRIGILGAPVETGATQRGAAMGPAAFRTAELAEALTALGHEVKDFGDAAPDRLEGFRPGITRMLNFEQSAAWARALRRQTIAIQEAGWMPLCLGGDHSISMGIGAGLAEFAASREREQFLLWLDAHPDFNTMQTSVSGNMHGVPVAFLCGLPGFDALLGRPLETPLNPHNVMMIGIRSIDPPERELLMRHGPTVHDMRAIDEHGMARLLAPFLERIAKRNGLLHVSLDVDFLDPDVAPGVGTTVPGGATVREAHLVMEMLHDSGLVSSLELAELNPFLDERGRTATLMTDLAASLFGRRTMDRPTRSQWVG
ncbi:MULTISPECIES: arginase [Rhodomicrobium]|uniref:arginase n=1 Tax=Rhodomicrobium TaxID=1068 RepID=UPI000B4BEB9B|nr:MULTISPECIES: arginase [Rhodomicrobium]